MKKILVTSTDMMMMQFLVPHVANLRENGYEVEVACSEVGGRFNEVVDCIGSESVHRVRLFRNPFKFGNLKGLKDLKDIINSGKYDLIWTNEPVMSVATRIAAKNARKNGTTVMYMVHGFHFYSGAPLKNWMIYYPIEKWISGKTDVIVTINKEDLTQADNLRCRIVKYIHGIGINTERLTVKSHISPIRAELGLDDDDFVILSVGELNDNKNQIVVIDAMSKLKDPRIHYVLCGKGQNLGKLKKRAASFGLERNVHFLGYRKDVVDICSQSDVFIMPSKREGLPVAALEAMYCGLPLLTSRCRGIVDVMEDGITGFVHDFNDYNGFADSIMRLKERKELRLDMGLMNREKVKPYCIQETKKEVLKIINDILEFER